ncbi:MAG: hypothetical protein AB1461_02530 [Thermodesulfobacteriota bacterium]
MTGNMTMDSRQQYHQCRQVRRPGTSPFMVFAVLPGMVVADEPRVALSGLPLILSGPLAGV